MAWRNGNGEFRNRLGILSEDEVRAIESEFAAGVKIERIASGHGLHQKDASAIHNILLKPAKVILASLKDMDGAAKRGDIREYQKPVLARCPGLVRYIRNQVPREGTSAAAEGAGTTISKPVTVTVCFDGEDVRVTIPRETLLQLSSMERGAASAAVERREDRREETTENTEKEREYGEEKIEPRNTRNTRNTRKERTEREIEARDVSPAEMIQPAGAPAYRMTTGAERVLLFLAERARNHPGWQSYTLAELSELVGLTEKQARYAREKLEEAGLIDSVLAPTRKNVAYLVTESGMELAGSLKERNQA